MTRPLRELRLIPRDPDSIAEQMACAMVNAGILADGKIRYLSKLGFTGREMVAHLDDATRIATRLVSRSHQPAANPRLVALARALGGIAS